MAKKLETDRIRECVCSVSLSGMLLFVIRVKREVKRVYRNGCRYNERLNTETGGSKTPRIHWVVVYYESMKRKLI
jgi:hypothetical protein